MGLQNRSESEQTGQLEVVTLLYSVDAKLVMVVPLGGTTASYLYFLRDVQVVQVPSGN